MRKVILILIVIGCLAANIAYAAEKTGLSAKEKRELYRELEPEHKAWFDMVTYVAAEEEKNVFLLLKNNKDRSTFIDTFWLQRDPTPGTPLNEYQDEIKKRFSYVNTEFKKGSSKPGWMTDMGKFYMILGKPVNIDRFESKAGLYPAQVWYYQGDNKVGLPAYFNVTFFRPRNTTEWRLYNPAVDGPQALLINFQPLDTDDQISIYNQIKELAPGLAIPAVTMIPNEFSPGLSPSLRTSVVLNNIYESPQKNINVSYATNFLGYKGFVNVEDSVNFIENTSLVSVTRYERFGFNFINISLKPKKISVGYNEERDKYFFNFEFSVSLKQDEKFVYQYTKNFEFYVEPDKVDALRGNGVVIHDSFPAIPGKYTLMVFAKNSIGKEFTYFEQEIKIMPEGGMPFLAKPVLGYKTEAQPENFFYSYKVNAQKLSVDTENTFRLQETPYLLLGVYNLTKELWETGRLEINLNGLSERQKFKKTYTLNLNAYDFKENLNILYKLSQEGFYSDYYEMSIRLIDKLGIVLDSKGAEFAISPFKTFAYPMEAFKRSSLANPFYFYYTVAGQYELAGNLEEAEKYYERCLENKPDFMEGYARFLNLLNQQKKYTKALVEVENLKKDNQFTFEYHLIKGTALFGMKDYENALAELIKANEQYDSDIRVLNLLGFTFLNLNDYKEALKAFAASLNIDKNQPVIKKTVDEVNEKIGENK